MSIPQAKIDEILSSVDIVDVIGSYVSLSKAGSNYKARCPFHSEKTPSFMVSAPKQIYHCFGCGAGGNVLSFLMSHEGLAFHEALRLLASKAGIVIEEDPREKKTVSDKAALYEINKTAHEYFCSQLDEKAAGYLKNRDITPQAARSYAFGMAPEGWSGLADYLKRRGASIDAALAAGLLIKGDRGPYDRFRGRLIIPIHDINGAVCGFGGRALAKDAEPKYLNSPESSIFNKGSILFNLNRAKDEIRIKGRAILCEGYFDVISLCLAGFPGTVGTMGTSLTDSHARLLGRYCKSALLCYDGDRPGQKSTIGAGATLLRQGFTVKVVPLPEGMDPDDFVRSKGPEAFSQAASCAADYIVFACRFFSEGETTMRDVAEHLLPCVRCMPNDMDQYEAVKKIAETLGVSEESVTSQLRKTRIFSATRDTQEGTPRAKRPLKPVNPLEKNLLTLCIKHPSTAKTYHHLINLEFIKDASIKQALSALLQDSGYFETEDIGTVCNKIANNDTINLLSEIIFDTIIFKDPDKAFLENIDKLEQREHALRAADLKKRINEAEKRGEDISNLLSEFEAIKKRQLTQGVQVNG